MEDNWDYLLSKFIHAGGLAENVIQGEGINGRGIFSINPSQRSKIFTPSKLMIKKDDIYLEDNKLRIRKDCKYDLEIRDFFNFYQDNFSWGSGGKETTEFFEKGLSLFNPNLKKLLKQYALVDIDERHQGKWDDVIYKQFLNSRAIKFRNSNVIAPVWELVNHKVRSLPFVINIEGISTPSYPPITGEIRLSYNNQSPLNRFFSYGFFSEETIVFSFPFSINIENLGIYLCCKGRDIKSDSIKIARSGKKIILEGLPIADLNHSRLPYDYFEEILRMIGDFNISRNFLMKIFQFNISIREQILYESQSINNEVAKILCEVMSYEIAQIPSYN